LAGFWIDTPILNTLQAQRCRDCGRWTQPFLSVPTSHGSTVISERKKQSLAFLLDLYLYFPDISCM
jgi:hypothetical protein